MVPLKMGSIKRAVWNIYCHYKTAPQWDFNGIKQIKAIQSICSFVKWASIHLSLPVLLYQGNELLPRCQNDASFGNSSLALYNFLLVLDEAVNDAEMDQQVVIVHIVHNITKVRNHCTHLTRFPSGSFLNPFLNRTFFRCL